ncbi:hypothetical protein D3C72_1609780 [compost metagenome]
MRRHDLQAIDGLFFDKAGKRPAILHGRLIGQVQRRTVVQGTEHGGVAEVSDDAGAESKAPALRQVQRSAGRSNVIEQGAMLDGDGLGRAGRTGGEQHIGDIVSRQRRMFG